MSCAILATVMLSTTIVSVMPSSAFAKAPQPNIHLVRHGDLNLASDKDIVRLHRQISRAARKVCSPSGIAALVRKSQINDCVDETRAEALQNLEQKMAMLTAETRPQN